MKDTKHGRVNPESFPGAQSKTVALDSPPPIEASQNPDLTTMIDAQRRSTIVQAGKLLQPGTLLGNRYQILQVLGEGGMGAVYKARDRELERIIALKVIRPDLAGHQEVLQRFKQELILARQVTDTNIIRIFDLGEADGVKFITMELVEGETLQHMLRTRGKLPVPEVVDMLEQMLSGLRAAHKAGVIHRDLKPGNIMRDPQGRVVVMDFGLARSLESDGMTKTGAMLGTIEYMSPEQALGTELDARSDLFTVGLICYELLTGKMPFHADSAVASLLRRTQERAAPMSDLDKEIPGVLSNIVSKCLERDPALRYQSAQALLDDLYAWQGKQAGATLSFHAKVGPWGQSLPWPIIGAIATVILLAASGWIWRDKLLSPLSTQQASAVPQVSLAILPFRNASGDTSLSWMGATVADMLRTDVGQAAALQTVSSDRINQIFHDLRVEPDANLNPETLRRVAEFTSADRLVWGQYLKLGDQIRIDATLQDLKRQRSFSLKVEASNEKELPKALQQLADSIEQDLALPAETIKQLHTTLLKPSSQSVQALRYYSEAMELTRQGKNPEALKQFEAATNEDPNFALAYSKLAATYAALGYGDKAEQVSRKAVDLSDKVSPQEQALIQAENARVTADYAKGIQQYEKLGEMLPNDPDIQYSLARLYEDSGAFDKARSSYDKILTRDPKNVNALLHTGWVEIRRDNAQGSLEYLGRALALAVQLQNDDEKAAILDAMGNAYHYLNQQDDAIRNYQQALDIKRRLGNKGAIAESLNLIAQAQGGIGKSDEAAKNYQEAARLRREVGDKAGLGRTLLDLATFNENLGHYNEALSAGKEALPLLREVGDRQNEAICLGEVGWIYLDKIDFENATTYLQQALTLRQQLGSPVDVADSLYGLGQVYTRMAQYDQSTDYFLKALELWRKAGDKKGEAFASYGLGRIFQYQGRYGAALKSEEDALKSWRTTNEHGAWLPEIQGSYGNSLTLLARWDDAQKNLDEALGLAHALKSDSLVAEMLNYKGDNFFYRGDTRSAKMLFEQASQSAASSKDPEQILISKFNLAKVAATEQNTPAVINSLTALARDLDRSGLKRLSIECSTYVAAARIESKSYSQAREVLERSVAESQKLGLNVLLAKSHYLLAETLRLTGNQAEAVHHYSEAHRIIDEIRKYAQTDDLMKRVDLAKIYQESDVAKIQHLNTAIRK
jgi:serine/threonine protein kinase/tetratricopeptide (TPR) repeat protein